MALKTTLSRGYAISYGDAGRGGAVMLIPGFMQSAAEFKVAGYIDRLSDRWRVLTVDPLAHGRSDKPHDPQAYRAPGVAADLVAVLDAEGIDGAVLWGYSRGAWLAMMAAIEFPQRVSAMIVGGGAFTGPWPTTIPAWVEPLSRGDWKGFWPLFSVPLDDATKERFERSNDPRALAAERTGRFEPPYVFDLGRVLAPVLIYCGGDDDPEDAVPSAEALHTELRVIEGRDHPGAFSDVDAVMALAIPFLESTLHTAC